MIVLTSANSRTQRHIIARLTQSLRPVRACGRSLDRDWLARHGVTDLVSGDLLDRTTLVAAFKGARTVVHLGPGLNSKESIIGQFVVDAAKAANVEHFVYVSVIHPQIQYLLNHQSKLFVEDYLIQSRLPFTILQPQHYFQNIRVKQILEQGKFGLPYSMSRPLGFVDMADLAEVVIKVLEEGPIHHFATYEIASAEHHSGVQIAAALSLLAGTPIVAEQLVLADAVAAIQHRFGGDPAEHDWTADAAHRLFGYYDRYGITGNGNVLAWLLGRSPTTLEGYLRRELTATALGAATG